MTRLEQLQEQQARMAKKQKQVAKAIAREKRAEKKKAEEAARLAEQEEAMSVWRFCRETKVSITVTEPDGKKRSLQLADYIRYQMAVEQEQAKAASKGGPA